MAQGELFSVYKHLMKDEHKEEEPDSSWWCPAQGQRQWGQPEIKETLFQHKKKIF